MLDSASARQSPAARGTGPAPFDVREVAAFLVTVLFVFFGDVLFVAAFFAIQNSGDENTTNDRGRLGGRGRQGVRPGSDPGLAPWGQTEV